MPVVREAPNTLAPLPTLAASNPYTTSRAIFVVEYYKISEVSPRVFVRFLFLFIISVKAQDSGSTLWEKRNKSKLVQVVGLPHLLHFFFYASKHGRIARVVCTRNAPTGVAALAPRGSRPCAQFECRFASVSLSIPAAAASLSGRGVEGDWPRRFRLIGATFSNCSIGRRG